MRTTPKCGQIVACALTAVVVICVASPSQAGDEPGGASIGWDAIGPERGHVVDVAVGHRQVLVVSRVGVLAADLDGGEDLVWRRDPRFPRNTRRIEADTDGSWWSSAQNAVCHTSDEGTTCVPMAPESYPVAVGPMGNGRAIVAVRGRTPGLVVAFSDDTPPLTVLSGVDPWSVVVLGEHVWAGSLGQGLYESTDGGLTFALVAPGLSISTLGFVGETLAVGLRDGRIEDPVSGAVLGTVEPGWATEIVSAAGETLVLSASSEGPETLWRLDGSSLSPLALPIVDDDPSHMNLTGLCPLPDGTVLVGTFRRGPLIYDKGDFRPSRRDFRASNVRGAVRCGDGLMVAMMGTGVYLSDAAATVWTGQHRFPGPVTDTVALSKDGDAVIAVDFDGVVRYDSSGLWTRTLGVRDPAAHAPNGLSDVRADDEGRWWGLTESKRLMLLGPQGWGECSERGAQRLDGDGEHLLLLTNQGFHALDSCEKPGKRVWPDVPMPRISDDARADGGWLAVPGALYRDGVFVASPPTGRVEALTGGVDRALVVVDKVVHSCEAGACEQVGVPFGESPSGVGWLADGRVWYAEGTGTIWASGGTEIPSPCSAVQASPNPGEAPWDILRVPWSMEGRRSAESAPQPEIRKDEPPPETVDKRSGSVGLAIVAGVAVVLLTASALIYIRIRRPRDGESTGP